MKTIGFFILTLGLLGSTLGHANESDDPSMADLFQELQNSASYGIQPVGLFSTTSEALMNALTIVGGETAILADHTRWKSQFQGVLIVDMRQSPAKVTIDYKAGSLDFNKKYPMAVDEGIDPTNPAIDLADAAINQRNLLHPENSYQLVFDMAVRCIGYGGQGLPAMITCGFFKDPRDFK